MYTTTYMYTLLSFQRAIAQDALPGVDYYVLEGIANAKPFCLRVWVGHYEKRYTFGMDGWYDMFGHDFNVHQWVRSCMYLCLIEDGIFPMHYRKSF
jgi:hypothetical protein